tara:strand:+ start:629 stop:1711 length:1083 start_codon:yes stop_codon:yes gene_type:complete
MIKVDTTITCPQSFDTKSKFKNYLVDNFVNEKTDPLRIYNFKLMKKYGDGFFYLIFKHPNIGILNHIYQTENEYEKSIELRNAQKILFEKNNIEYNVSEPYSFYKQALTKKEYGELHTSNLRPLSIKIDVEYFKLEMEEFLKYGKPWGDRYIEYPRNGIPLINLNGQLTNDPEPACYPLDRWNWIHSSLYDKNNDQSEENKINFSDFLFNVSQFEDDDFLFETGFSQPTPLLDIKSLNSLNELKPHMVRSCVFHWGTLAHLKPHFDTWHPSRWLRLWGTTDPEKVKIRYKKENSSKKNFYNSHFEKWEYYEPIENVEAGRLYLHDSSVWHDAYSMGEDTFQFFIALNLNSIPVLKTYLMN